MGVLRRGCDSYGCCPGQGASEDRGVLTGEVPKLQHLRRGYFRQREHIFEPLWAAFQDWLPAVTEDTQCVPDKTPVFWISGRSGEGKSVLLLQLMARFLLSIESSPLLHIKRGNAIPLLLERAARGNILSGRLFAAIDDIYDLDDRDAWDEDIRTASSFGVPSLAIITCGPTEHRGVQAPTGRSV